MDFTGGIDKLYAKYCLIDTLLNITRIPSPSTLEQEMTAYAAHQLSSNGFYVNVDSHGNVMARRGRGDNFPLLNAHMDTTMQNAGVIRRLKSPYLEIAVDLNARRNTYAEPFVKNGKFRSKEMYSKKHEFFDQMAKFDREYEIRVERPLRELPYREQYDSFIKPDSWKPEAIQYIPDKDIIISKLPQQIGGDDKAGVAIILCLASMTDLEFKVLLTVGEEPPFDGNYGVRTIPSQFYSDVLYCLTLDRQRKDTIVTEIGGLKICTKEFEKIITHYAKFCGVKLKNEHGFTADAEKIAKYCETVNLSAGYYEPHSREDYIKVNETLNMMCVVATCIENIGLRSQYRQRYG